MSVKVNDLPQSRSNTHIDGDLRSTFPVQLGYCSPVSFANNNEVSG